MILEGAMYGILSHVKNAREWAFFKNAKGQIQFNNTCCRCRNRCKQSFRSTIVCCPIMRLRKRAEG